MPSPHNRLRAPKLQTRQTNWNKNIHAFSMPFASKGCKPQQCQCESAPSPWAHPWRSLDTPLPHGASWDGICPPILVLPNLALPYIQILPSTLPAKSFKHVSPPPLHSGVSPIAAPSQTLPSSPTPADWRGPTGSTGRKTSQLGAFYNVSQTKPRHCQITVTCSLNNCFL